MKSVMMPFGPKDWADGRRKKFMDELLPRLVSHDWSIGVQLMTGSLSWDGIHNCCEWIRQNNGSIVWHASDIWPLWLGHDDFDVEAFQRQLSPAEPLIKAGLLDAINLHLGIGRWAEWPEQHPELIYDLTARYDHFLSAEEVEHQIENHLQHLQPIVDYLGHDRILLENTSSWCSLPNCHFLAQQFGAGGRAHYFAEKLGCGVTLDEGHRQEDHDILCYRDPAYPVPSPAEITDVINFWQPRFFHLDGAQGVFANGRIDGPIDAHQPVTLANAEKAGLYAMVRYANSAPDCLGICVEACGRNFWEAAGYVSASIIADDELAKWVSADTIAKVVEVAEVVSS